MATDAWIVNNWTLHWVGRYFVTHFLNSFNSLTVTKFKELTCYILLWKLCSEKRNATKMMSKRKRDVAGARSF